MTINKNILVTGSIITIFYGAITWLTFGWPKSVCQILNSITFGIFSESISEMHNGFYYENINNDMPTVPYLILFFIIFGFVLYSFKRVKSSSTNKATLWLVLGFSVLFRLLTFWGEPIHENDIYRYLWDGKSVAAGINPFKYAPSDVFMADFDIDYDYYDITSDVTLKAKDFDGEDDKRLAQLITLRDDNQLIYSRIGHWQVPTIYPPVTQILFALSSWIYPDSLNFMRFFFLLFDMGVLLLIVALLKHFNKDPCLAMLYGWLPLVVMQLSNSGHYDAIAIFFVLLSVYFYCRQWLYLSVSVLAIATLTKFFPVVLFPILFQRKWFRKGLVFSTVMVIFYLPFIIWDNTGVSGVFEGLHTYNRDWSYHSSVFDLVYYSLDGISKNFVETLFPAKIIVGFMYLGFLSFLVFNRNREVIDIVKKAFLAIAGLFIINPVCDPWYYCWVVPFLCLFHYRSWIWLSSLLMLSYLNFHTDIPYVTTRFWNIKLIAWLTYVPFYAMLGYEMWRQYEIKRIKKLVQL
ncbi:MAG: alpha-1,6-mannosyltransferase [Lysobacterales bacterium]|jgi:alpha-1,6-mannosyltransferase